MAVHCSHHIVFLRQRIVALHTLSYPTENTQGYLYDLTSADRLLTPVLQRLSAISHKKIPQTLHSESGVFLYQPAKAINAEQSASAFLYYIVKEEPQPQVVVALGLRITN